MTSSGMSVWSGGSCGSCCLRHEFRFSEAFEESVPTSSRYSITSISSKNFKRQGGERSTQGWQRRLMRGKVKAARTTEEDEVYPDMYPRRFRRRTPMPRGARDPQGAVCSKQKISCVNRIRRSVMIRLLRENQLLFTLDWSRRNGTGLFMDRWC